MNIETYFAIGFVVATLSILISFAMGASARKKLLRGASEEDIKLFDTEIEKFKPKYAPLRTAVYFVTHMLTWPLSILIFSVSLVIFVVAKASLARLTKTH